VDAETGYAVGDYNTILKTTNGGGNWVSRPAGTTQLYGVHFPRNVQTGYAVGYNGTILKTTNGGEAWVFLSSGTTFALYSVHFPSDDQTGYAVGEGGTVLKTTDGGVNWTNRATPASNILYSVQFPFDASTGYAVGASGIIMKTTDGGASFVEETTVGRSDRQTIGRLKAIPNPFTSFTTLPGHSSDRFTLYDVSGRRVGVYKGDRIGEGLRAGVYFVRPGEKGGKPLRVVKLR
jgi:photosystem II stability/assembly factor-like uncharacterized protein